MYIEVPTLFLSALTLVAPTDPVSAPKSDSTPLLENAIELPALQDDEKKKREDGTFRGSATAGATASFGNTEVKRANFNAAGDYKINDTNRISGLFDWLYGQEKDQVTKQKRVTQRRVRGALQYDHFFNEKTYGFARADALGDSLQNLALRLIGSVGIGHTYIKQENSEWSVEAGLAYVYQDFKNSAATALLTGRPHDDPTGDLSARLATRYWRQVTEDLKYSFWAEWFPNLEESGRHVVYAANQIDYAMGKGFTTSLRWELDYNSHPSFRADGARLERLDHRLIWGLGYTF